MQTNTAKLFKIGALSALALGALHSSGAVDLTTSASVRTLGALFTFGAATLALTRNSVLDLIPCSLVRTVDGDTIHINHAGNEFPIRIPHIDAPEKAQPGGLEATAFLNNYLDGKLLTFRNSNQDGSYGRQLKVLYADGEDVQLALVAAGHAWTDTTYKDTPHAYTLAMLNAQQAQRGLWADAKAIHPKYFRQQHKATRERAQLIDELLSVSK